MSSPGAGCPQGPQLLGSLLKSRLWTYGQRARVSCWSWAWWPPRSVVANHGVEDGQHLAHDGDEGRFLFNPAVEQALVVIAQDRVVLHCAECGHVQHLAHRCAATGNMPAAVPLAAVILVGRDADQGTNHLAREGADFGKRRERGGGPPRG